MRLILDLFKNFFQCLCLLPLYLVIRNGIEEHFGVSFLLELLFITVFACILSVLYTVYEHKRKKKVYKKYFAPLLTLCKQMINQFEADPLFCPDMQEARRSKISNRDCYIALKEVIYPSIRNAYEKFFSGRYVTRCIGLSCTSTVMEIFDEQSDFVQKILELDKILNSKKGKEKKK